ncbi:cytochrome P450 monooxygenase-like protein [Aaosphaeria arxii CBS 175.79]|uniref:Cytochrome P450 monooxygenase-like protein n=1 Tax=Aaosphaeria arxii CBS 175.79 TaxID=1450172 RepID=A0A6A5XVI5_9PLEO|nr:cytochrome P450 monooxygenase-like protein [Aaosphaeria arxii CBS 175.79]KAF2017328.1 cytochrome P450 monooxygenase-like protein [Aaosphaeria arxii CBS 175.79]
MILQELSGNSHILQTAFAAAGLFALLTFISHLNHRAKIANLPSFGGGDSREKSRNAYLQSAKKLYIDGYKKFKGQVYRMMTSDDEVSIVVPPRFLPELRKLPDDILSFPKAVDKSMEVKYTKILTDEPLISHSVKADLTPALVRLNPIICQEVDEAVKEELPPCEDWTTVYIYMKLVHIVAKVSGRVFVGPELCRDQDYLDSGINYTMELIGAQQAIKLMHPWLRPFLASRLPQVKNLRRREKLAKQFLEPVVQARRNAEKDPDYEKPDDLLQWFLNRTNDYGIDSTAYIAQMQLGTIFAAIHTTTLTTTNILYTLAVKPEYIEPMRDEIRQAMADNDGIITSRALQKMEKLDSFMKETMRFYPAGFTSFNRRVMKGITLSDGTYIPAGAIIEVPSHAIYQDDENYPSADEFDGFRFSKLRKGGGATEHARNQFVTTNEQNLGFGYGRHACPGRFFAANEIKMILARLILDYDIKNPDGVTERHPNTEVGRSTAPDASKPLLFRKVQI